jgi:hypothetical protein
VRRALTVLLLLLAAGRGPGGVPDARAQGQWTTYLHMSTANDLLVLGDTVWIATGEAGLVRYQRSSGTWSTITREPSGLAGNNVRAIVFDGSGNLFAAVPGKGVSRLGRDGRWSLINAFDGLPSDTVLAMRAQGDTVWMGTTRGLALWDGEAVAGSVPDLGTPSPFSNNNVNGVAITGDTLFVSTPNAIYLARLSQRLRTWTEITGTIGLTNLNVRGIATNGRELLALASGQSVSNPLVSLFTSFRWAPATGSWPLDFPGPGAATSVRRLRDDHGVVLATTLAGTHVRGPGGGWTQFPASPATDNVDATGLEVGAQVVPNLPVADTLVFASFAGRLLERALPAWTSRTPPGPVGNRCRGIAWSDGSVYASYDGEGVSRLRDGVWRNFPGGSTCSGPACDTTFAATTFPATMLADPLGHKWLSFWEGPLAWFDDTRDPPEFRQLYFASGNADSAHLHYTIHAVSADSTRGSQAGRWFGLDSDRIGADIGNPLGLDLYDAQGNFIRNFDTTYPGMRNGLIRGLVCDRDGVMWVGYKGSSGAGLSTFPVPGDLSVPIALSDVSGSNLLDVFGLAARGDSVWVLATDGLRRYRQRARTLAAELDIAGPPALASMHPLAVGPDGTVFVGTTGGLRVHRRGQAPVDYTPDNSPLADIEVRAVFSEPSGAVWIGTAGGINRFDPNYLPPPEPQLAALRVTLYPNPVWLTGAGFRLRISGDALAYEGEVLDLGGRLVHRFSVGGNGNVFWTGRDLSQRALEPGVYFVRVRGGGAEATSRVVVLR